MYIMYLIAKNVKNVTLVANASYIEYEVESNTSCIPDRKNKYKRVIKGTKVIAVIKRM